MAKSQGISKVAVVAAVAGFAAVVALAGLLLRDAKPTALQTTEAEALPSQTIAPPAVPAADPPKSEPLAGNVPSRGAAGKPNAVVPIDDDGQTLWASPTAGKPITVSYLPAGAQVIFVLRPAELLQTAEGAKLWDALEPAGELVKGQLRAILGVELAEIESLTIAFTPDDAGLPQTSFVMQLQKPIPEAKLLEAWGNPRATQLGSKRIFQAARFAYYLPEPTDQRLVVIASTAQMPEIVESDGPPLLRKGIEALLRDSDSTRHFTLLFTPSYLLTDGQTLLVGDLERLRDPLAQFFDEGLPAVLLSAHLDDALFLEMRTVGPADKDPQEMAKLLRSRLERVAERVENYVASLEPSPYGRLIVNRFPRMVQLLSDFTRGGVENRQAVLRCYLPDNAAHNLLLGAELVLQERPARGGPREAKESAAPATITGGAVQALDKKISLSFPRDTLEHSLEMLGKEIDVDVEILGPDLQLEGITKNQSFGLEEREQPAREILGKILKLANSEGKLVYVIRPKGGREAIFITTRTAAAKRGERLPAEAASKTPAKKQ